MFKECEQQKAGPTQQETEVLEEKHEARSVGLYSIHLWKLMKEKIRVRAKPSAVWQKFRVGLALFSSFRTST